MKKAVRHIIHPFVVALACSCSGTDTGEPSPAGSGSSVEAAMGGDEGSGSPAATNVSPVDPPPPIGGPDSNVGPVDPPPPIGGPDSTAGPVDPPPPIGGPDSSGGTGGDIETGTGGDMETGTGGDVETDTGGDVETGTGGDVETDTGGDMETDTGGDMETDTGGDMETDTGGDMETDTGGNVDPTVPDPTMPEVTVFLAGDNVDTDGPLQTVVEDLSFSGGGHILVRPTDITTEPNTKHPVAIWGPGGGTPPRDYLQLLTRMASQGFVIVGIRESTGDSVLMSAAIDWLEEQDADPNSAMHQRLILDRVGVFGHSMGGLSSEAAALADSRVSTALLDNSGSFSHDALVSVTIPVGIIYGETGQERPNAEGDFANPGNQGPCWLSMMAGGGHGSGPWDGASANVAWMRWHLGGENFRKDDFIGDGGDYNNNGIWRTEFKNWDGWKNWNE